MKPFHRTDFYRLRQDKRINQTENLEAFLVAHRYANINQNYVRQDAYKALEKIITGIIHDYLEKEVVKFNFPDKLTIKRVLFLN